MILVVMSACGNDRGSSTEMPEAAERMPRQETKQPSDHQENAGGKSGLEDVAAGIFDPGYIAMLRPGVISEYDKTVRKYARRYLFDWRLISAQIYTESRFRSQARSYRGALGLMQIMPGTARWLEGKVKSDVPELRTASQMLVDPEVNIHLGCYYDAMLLNRIKDAGNTEDRSKMMLAAYNAGPGNLNRARRKSSEPESWEGVSPHLPAETRKYVPAIYDRYGIYKQWAILRPY